MQHNKMTHDPITALDGVLEAERQALLSGKLETLHMLLDEKETLVRVLNDTSQTDALSLKALSGKLQRNQQLLDGAMEGIRAVTARLAQVRQVKGGFETYDAMGQKRNVALGGAASVEQRI